MSTTYKPALLIIDVQEDFCPPVRSRLFLLSQKPQLRLQQNGSLAVPDGRAILPTINALLALPFPPALKLATKDHHPPQHISFHTSPLHPASLQGHLQPFTSTITITNPHNPAETYESHVWPPHCVVDTPGNAFAKGLDVAKVGRVVLKGRDERVEMYSAFRTPLRDPPMEEGGLGELGKLLTDEGVTDVIVAGLAGDYCVKASAVDCMVIGRETGRGWRCWVVEEGVRSVGGESAWEVSKKDMLSHGVKIVSLQDVKKRFFPELAA